jgi:RHH-type proline utilization regulon transcriptional repressor/proline dehydrogenase/delta 1-pyrroline-5-carboxylate dehydrogenase
VLHVLRYERDGLSDLLEQIGQTGYGLTMGVHTRIDETLAQVVHAARAGNLYANRNIVGAVVGVQPFGGEGLSGTGPKAGGPLYLLRLLSARPDDAARLAVAAAGDASAPPLRGWAEGAPADEGEAAFGALQAWARERDRESLARACQRYAAAAPARGWRQLPGPTGEANLYAVLPRDAVLCLAGADGDRLQQLAATLAVGGRAVWPADARPLRDLLPAPARERVTLAQDWRGNAVHFDAVLHAGPADDLRGLLQTLAARPGPIVGVTSLPGDAVPSLERLMVERSLSINTAAAGGNASLMTIG